MNIVLSALLSGVCGMLLVGIPFLLKFLCDISFSLRRLRDTYDYYMFKIVSRTFHVHFLHDSEDEEEE